MAEHPAYPRADFRLGPLEAAVRARGDHPNTVVRRDLERAYALLERELATMSFSEAEWLLLLDVTNGTLFEPASIPLLWAEVADALDHAPSLAAKWGVDGAGLVARLRALSPLRAWAVVDALERCWQQTTAAAESDLRAALRAIVFQRLRAAALPPEAR